MNFKTPRPETFSVSGRVLVLQGFASKFAHSALTEWLIKKVRHIER